MSFSTLLLQNPDDKSSLGSFSNRMNKRMKGVKILMQQRKPDEEESKNKKTTKKLCMCSPTDHQGSFRCRYHRSTSTQKVNTNPHLVAGREYLKLGCLKPPLSRFSKAPVAASELPR